MIVSVGVIFNAVLKREKYFIHTNSISVMINRILSYLRKTYNIQLRHPHGDHNYAPCIRCGRKIRWTFLGLCK